MADFNIGSKTTRTQQRAGVRVDAGLRSYMLGVYNYMAVALAVTGLASYVIFQLSFTDGGITPIGETLFASSFRWVVILAPLAMVFFLAARIGSMSLPTVRVTYFVYSALVGVSLTPLFVIYTSESITSTFFVTATAFGALSLYGYTTKRDLTGFGSFLIMGLFGLMIAWVVNMFLADSVFQLILSVVGVLIFAGLTAYDTQRIKDMYFLTPEGMREKQTIRAALSLYLNFLNMFIMLLHLFGNRE